MIAALQAVVFDFDGVIADSEPMHLAAFQQALAEQSVTLTANDYYSRYLGYDDVGMFEAVARDRTLPMDAGDVMTLVARKGVILQEMLRRGSILFPGAIEFIRATAAVVPIAIASGALRHEILQVIEAAGVHELFTTVVAAGETPESKPSPAPYLLAFEQLRTKTGQDLEKHRCVAIEDSKWGLESARAAGLRCVGVTTSYGAEELDAAELVAKGLNELTVAALDRLCAKTLSTR